MRRNEHWKQGRTPSCATRLFRLGPPIIGLLAAFLVAGCASTSVQPKMEYAGKRLPRPDHILVYDFAASPDDVKLDRGVGPQLAKHIKKGTPRTEKEISVGRKVANAMSEELVKEIRKLGLSAERAAGHPKNFTNALLVEGQFLSIDEGNRTERMVIGFGAGRTAVEAHVQVYEVTPEGQKEIEEFQATTKSGRKPGMAEMMGVGAIAGHLLTSTVVSGAISVSGEASWEKVEADAKKIAKNVAQELGHFFVKQG
jgi:hypothetical protein